MIAENRGQFRLSPNFVVTGFCPLCHPGAAVRMFPTYSVYVNGSLVITYAQSKVADFVAKDQTYQLTPSQIP